MIVCHCLRETVSFIELNIPKKKYSFCSFQMFCMPDVYIHIKCKTQAQPNHSSKLHHKSIFELCARIYRTDVQCSKWICCMLLVRFSHVQWTNVYNAPISMDYRQHQHLPNNNYRSFIATGSHISDIVLKGLSAFANWALIDEVMNIKTHPNSTLDFHIKWSRIRTRGDFHFRDDKNEVQRLTYDPVA